MTLSELRGFEVKTVEATLRDIRRFLGCFIFEDAAGQDLANLVVSVFKRRLMKRLILSKLWNAKNFFLQSLKGSLRHFIGYLENEDRVHRAFDGLTTALANITRVIVC